MSVGSFSVGLTGQGGIIRQVGGVGPMAGGQEGREGKSGKLLHAMRLLSSCCWAVVCLAAEGGE